MFFDCMVEIYLIYFLMSFKDETVHDIYLIMKLLFYRMQQPKKWKPLRRRSWPFSKTWT